MDRFDTLIIGGGAAGITAAISAGRKGASVVLCEKMPQLGKKILASGNGRCNLLNEKLDSYCYNPAAQDFVKSVFAAFGKADIANFFKELGLEVYSENNRIFPVTKQSSSVLKVLELELKKLRIGIELNFEAVDISCSKNGFIVRSKSGRTIESSNLIIACGGKTYPALGSDGSSYGFAKRFGHSIIEPVPSAVPVVTKDRICHLLQGQKISAAALSIIDGKVTNEATGELLFTKYGLSGTAILDVSRDISVAINREKKKDVAVSIDMVPFMDREKLKLELEKRTEKGIGSAHRAVEDILAGILPNKFGTALKDLFSGCDCNAIAGALKDRRFKITGTRGWNEAEFTAGGIDVSEVKKETLESKLKEGLYFAGESLDVDGKRGGYNLAWAWASGFIAGLRG
jgi:predicted Rossmann fold flavoprotein